VNEINSKLLFIFLLLSSFFLKIYFFTSTLNTSNTSGDLVTDGKLGKMPSLNKLNPSLNKLNPSLNKLIFGILFL